MLKKKVLKLQLNQSGMATVEAVPLLVIFLLLLAYSMGSFGINHTAILNSIAARNYAFETFRHRPTLTYFHDRRGGGDSFDYTRGNRTHLIVSEYGGTADDHYFATERYLKFGMPTDQFEGRTQSYHEKQLDDIQTGVRNLNTKVDPVWIKTQYGICLNKKCGDSN